MGLRSKSIFTLINGTVRGVYYTPRTRERLRYSLRDYIIEKLIIPILLFLYYYPYNFIIPIVRIV